MIILVLMIMHLSMYSMEDNSYLENSSLNRNNKRCVKTLAIERPVVPMLNLEGKLIAGDLDNNIRMWDPALDWQLKMTIDNHDFPTILKEFGKERLLSGSESGKIRLWDVEYAQCAQKISTKRIPIVDVVQIDDKRVACVGDPYTCGSIQIWDVASGKEITSLKGVQDERFGAIVLGKEGQLISANWGFVKIWDLSTGKPIKESSSNYRRAINYLVKSGEILIGAYKRMLEIWDLSTGDYIAPLYKSHCNILAAIACQKYLITTSQNKEISIWDPIKKECVYTFCNEDIMPERLAYFENNQLAVGSGEKSIITIWDISSILE